VIQEISDALPEEYRYRYRNQRARKKMLEEFRSAKTALEGGFFGRIKHLFKH